MKKIQLFALLSVVLAVSLGFAFPMGMMGEREAKPLESASWSYPVTNESTLIEDTRVQDDEFVPVEDMHHFMEYVCEPSYKALKKILAEEPQEWTQWKKFRNHALVLAATSELVAARVPDDFDEAKTKQWKEISLAVHDSGALLYQSSRKYKEAKKYFGEMTQHCNQCHEVFADGKHQL